MKIKIYPLLFVLSFAVRSFSQTCPGTDNYEPNNSSQTAYSLFTAALGKNAQSQTILSKITYDDQDWYSVGLDITGTVTIDLTNLPADYDLELYGINGLGSFIAGSYNSGTQAEHISYTYTATQSTIIYIKVYGHSLSQYSSNCYTLKVNWVPCSILSLIPALSSPGTGTSPGEQINTLTPTLDWDDMQGATSYGVYVKDVSTNTLVVDNNCASSISQYKIPDNILSPGKTYRWNVQANINCGSCQSKVASVLYFNTAPGTGTCTAPTSQASNIYFSSVSANQMTVNWSNGNGSRRLVIVNTTNYFDNPANGVDYNTTPYNGTGEQIVYNGPNSSFTLAGLIPNTAYWFKVIEANCSGGSSLYDFDAGTGNPARQATLCVAIDNSVITSQPQSGVFCSSIKGQLSVGVNTSGLSFQWEQKNNSTYTVLSGETNNTFSTSNAGTYRCQISNGCGSTVNSDDATVSFKTCTGAVPNFSASKTTIYAGESVQFIDLSTGGPVSWQWLFEHEQVPSGTTAYKAATSPNPTVQFLYPGCYKVTLGVADGTGAGNSLSLFCYITVLPNPHTKIPEAVARAKDYPSGNAGDPVNTATGAFTFSMKDFSEFSLGKEIAIERRYNSRDTFVGVFGRGWSSLLDVGLDISDPYQWKLRHADGHITYHVPYPTGGTRSLYPGLKDSLYYLYDGVSTRYVYVEHSGTRWYFSPAGLLDSVVDLNGNPLRLMHTQYSIELQIPNGKIFFAFVNTAKRVNKISDDAGNHAYYYAYNYLEDNTHLDSAMFFDDGVYHTTRFKYNNMGLTEVYDPNGNRVIQNTYNPEGTVAEQYDAFNDSTTFQYNSPSTGQTTVKNPLHKSKIMSYDSSYRLLANKDELNNTKRYYYNINNFLDSSADELGNTTKYTYDARLNLSTITDPLNNKDSISYSIFNTPSYIKDANGNVTVIQYDGYGNDTSIALPTGGIVRKQFNRFGLETLFINAKNDSTTKTYNDWLNLQQIATRVSSTTFSYDDIGRMVTKTDGRGNTDSLYYNQYNQATRVVDGMGNASLFSYDKNGNLVASTDRTQNTTTFLYDAKDRLVTIHKPNNSTTTFEYDPLDRKSKKRDAEGNTTIFGYDDASRLTSVSDSVLGTLNSFRYDAHGNRTTRTDSKNNTWVTRYDTRNLPVSVTNPLGDSSTVAYWPTKQVKSRTNELGKTTWYAYDKAGKLIQATDPLNNMVNTFYDQNGNMDSVRDARGNTRKWAYDHGNRVQSFNDGFGNYQYKWDSAGNLAEYHDLEGNILKYGYNQNNKRVSNSYNGSLHSTFTLDNNNRIVSATTTEGGTSVLYDSVGRVVKTIGYFADTTTYTYSPAGNIISLLYPGNKEVQYRYNSLNLCTAVITWGNDTIKIYRDNNGKIDSIHYPNKFRTTVKRDNAGQITSWLDYKDNSDTSLFNANLLIREKTGWVLKDTGIKVLSPVFQSKDISATYGVDDRIINYGDETFTVNKNGSVKAASSPEGTNSYTYNADGSLASYSQHGLQKQILYNAFGQRIESIGQSKTVGYTIDDVFAGRPLSLVEMDAGKHPIAYNIYTPDGLLLSRDSAGTVQYFHYNNYGNTIALSDASGKITDTYAYGVFGDNFTHTGHSTQPFTFEGMYGLQKDGTDLYYDWARFYDANTGRFLSKDPYPLDVSSTQGVDRYTYGLNNPLLSVDLNGLYAQNNTSYDDADSWGSETALEKSIKDILEDPNSHIFPKSAHNLEDIVEYFDGPENTLKTILTEVYKQVPNVEGKFGQIVIQVDGFLITVRGTVINGVIRLGTIFKNKGKQAVEDVEQIIEEDGPDLEGLL